MPVMDLVTVSQVCSPSMWEVEAGSSEFQGHSLLITEFEASLGYLRTYLKKKIKQSRILSMTVRVPLTPASKMNTQELGEGLTGC